MIAITATSAPTRAGPVSEDDAVMLTDIVPENVPDIFFLSKNRLNIPSSFGQ